MKYLLATTILFLILFFWAFNVASNAHSDDFGAGILVWIIGLIVAILTIIYIMLAFWNHSFF
jgi:amino acid transporter